MCLHPHPRHLAVLSAFGGYGQGAQDALTHPPHTQRSLKCQHVSSAEIEKPLSTGTWETVVPNPLSATSFMRLMPSGVMGLGRD